MDYISLIRRLAPNYGVPTELALAVAGVESDFDPLAKSPKNAMGLMQLIPATAERFGVTNPYDPEQNVTGGLKYLRWLLDKYNGNVELALAGYNAGEGAVDKYGGIPPFKETQAYVPKVLARMGKTPDVRMASTDEDWSLPTGDPVTGQMDMPMPTPQGMLPPTMNAFEPDQEKPGFMDKWLENPLTILGLSLMGSSGSRNWAEGLGTGLTMYQKMKDMRQEKANQQQRNALWSRQLDLQQMNQLGLDRMNEYERATTRNEAERIQYNWANLEHQRNQFAENLARPEVKEYQRFRVQTPDGGTRTISVGKNEVLEDKLQAGEQVIGVVGTEVRGGRGGSNDPMVPKLERALTLMNTLESLAFGNPEQKQPGIFTGRSPGLAGVAGGAWDTARNYVTQEDPRYVEYIDLLNGSMAAVVKAMGDTGNIAVSEQNRALSMFPNPWKDTEQAAMNKFENIRELLQSWVQNPSAFQEKKGTLPPETGGQRPPGRVIDFSDLPPG